MITLKLLRDLNACAEAQTAFEKAFPNGAATWQAVAAHPDCQKEWKGWVAVHAPGLTLAERLSFADQSDEPAYWRGEVAFSAPGLSLDERLSLANQSDDPDFWRGWVKERYYVKESKP